MLTAQIGSYHTFRIGIRLSELVKFSLTQLLLSVGFPHGSILGPLLFLCYVNDMIISIDPDCKLLLYADDSTILFSHKYVAVISSKLGKV